MPRAFLITHRRYNGAEEFQATGRDYSPERGVRCAEYSGGQPTSDGASDCGSETSSECPEELYNLTKLAEVSLAAAAGTLIHPSKEFSYEAQFPGRWDRRAIEEYSSGRTSEENESRGGLAIAGLEKKSARSESDASETELSLRERTRLFFERIETERENFETRSGQRVRDGQPTRSEGSQGSSLSRSNEDEEISGISGSKDSAEYHKEGERNEQRSKSVLTTLSRKGTSSSASSSSEGSKSDDSEDHECPDCGKKYSTSSNLARHRQTHRSLGDKKARRCPHCDKIYVSMPAFSMHVRTHNQGCKCHYCGKCFSRPWLLQGHIRTHTGEKPFKCTICNKAFADKSNLRAHVQTHSNTKPHVCGRCGKAFALKSYLYKHEESSCMRSHHRGLSEKRESSVESLAPSVNSAAPNASIHRTIEPTIVASPTSVIVQCTSGPRDRSDSSSSPAFSRIIRHTKNHPVCEDTSPVVKRHCGEKLTSGDVVTWSKTGDEKPREFLSRMVIRTSVISPNPEHLSRLGGGSMSVKKSPPFDFTDPARSSAFSRPPGMSLNLAIA